MNKKKDIHTFGDTIAKQHSAQPIMHYELCIMNYFAVFFFIKQKKRRAKQLIVVFTLLLRGGYLLSHFRSTIGVVRLNFSVRNG